MDIRVLRPGDDRLVAAASHLFDGPARPDATTRFLAEDGHHLLVAYEDGQPVGFVSGVEVTHPDKGTEMLLYELAVDEPFRRRGVGRALVERLGALARTGAATACGSSPTTTTRRPAPPTRARVASPRPGRSWRSGRSEARHPIADPRCRCQASRFSPQKQANGFSLYGGTST